MTIIVAQRCGDSVWIGSDSRWTSNDFIMPVTARKWINLDGWHIGLSGYARHQDLLEKKRPEAGAWAAHTPVTIGEIIRQAMVDDKWTSVPAGRESGPPAYDCQAIIVSPWLDVFELHMTGSLCPMGTEFAAVGAGCDLACGAAFALATAAPSHRIRTAIAAACKYNTTCGGEPFVERIDRAANPRPIVPRWGAELLGPPVIQQGHQQGQI